MKKREQEKVWLRIFGLKVGDRVRVHRDIDPIEHRNAEGVIRRILTHYLPSHHGAYVVSIRGNFNGELYCRIEELEKIGEGET